MHLIEDFLVVRSDNIPPRLEQFLKKSDRYWSNGNNYHIGAWPASLIIDERQPAIIHTDRHPKVILANTPSLQP